MNTTTTNIFLFLKGMAMGVAEVIPGVSGGTIAFVTGIYERLLAAIKHILGPTVIRTWQRDGLAAAWAQADGAFLLTLLAGMASGIVAGIFSITHLLEHYPALVWAFFFGLIIASAIYVGQQVSRWGLVEGLALLVGTAVAYYITVAAPAQGNEALWFVFLSGVIAISALILPGISGSFILLLMGMYTYIIPMVRQALSSLDPQSLVVVGTFGLGCLVGLATFSRVLTWTFQRYHNPTMALLTGFMVGSLNKIWPWREVVSYRANSQGEQVPFLEANVWPSEYSGEPYLVGALVLMALGFALVFLLGKLSPKES